MTLEIKNNGNVWTGYMKGRLDTLASVQFNKDMEPLIVNADKDIILDMNELEFISSSGLRCLLALRKKSVNDGGSITITGAKKEIMEVFKITGFTSLFKFA